MAYLIRRSGLVVMAALLLALSACGEGEAKPVVTDSTPSISAVPTMSPTGLPSAEATADPTLPGFVTTGPNPGIPTDFPTTRIPLLAGAVALPLGPGSGENGAKGWVLELELAREAGACFNDAAAALVARGFTKQPGQTFSDGTREAQFTAPGWAVIISTSPDESGGCRLGYEVGQLADPLAE